jgi:hypothetical protein
MVNVYREYAIWKPLKLAREFRENLAGYLESDKPPAITRHGETVGFYIPAQKRSPKAELQAMRAAAKDLDEMIASWWAAATSVSTSTASVRTTITTSSTASV